MCINSSFLSYNMHLQEKEMVHKNSWRKESIEAQKVKRLIARNDVPLKLAG